MVKITAIGNIGNDATILTNGTNKSIAFSIASTKSYTNKEGNKVQDTTWIKCYADFERFEKLAAFIKKGAKVYVRGNFSLHNWKNEKTKKLETDIRCHVDEVQLLDKKEKYTPEMQEKFDLIIEAANKDKDFAKSIQNVIANGMIDKNQNKAAENENAQTEEEVLVDEETGEIMNQNSDDLPF